MAEQESKPDKTVQRVTVGKERWTIVLADKRRGFTSDDLDGLTDYDTKTIHLARRLGKKQRASTLLHELLHVIAPDRAEATVKKIENDLFPLLWRQGWRPDF